MPTLYGIPIPAGAQQVEVRPVFGRGQRRLMYRGPVERDGVFITEDVIADHVANDEAFWQYVQAQVNAKALPAPQAGVWMFRLSVCFQDQHGAPATLDPDAGLTSRVTAEAYEFYRGASKSDESGAVNTLATALSQSQAMQSQAAANMAQVYATAARDIATATMREAMAPLIEAQKLIAENARRAEERADGVTVDLYRQLSQRPKESSGSGLGLLRDLLGVAREAKTFLN